MYQGKWKLTISQGVFDLSTAASCCFNHLNWMSLLLPNLTRGWNDVRKICRQVETFYKSVQQLQQELHWGMMGERGWWPKGALDVSFIGKICQILIPFTKSHCTLHSSLKLGGEAARHKSIDENHHPAHLTISILCSCSHHSHQ